jgi:hypothetical protein
VATDDEHLPKNRPLKWPGMPTKRTQFFEWLIVLFGLPLYAITVALLLSLIESCRLGAIDQEGQAPPPIEAQPADP